MEKITIKPSAKEIILRGKPEDGHLDVFSYNYDGNVSNGLGSLFVVGQVHPATDDTSYMVNLIASLAKREYYSQPDISQKEAFSRTLKKINEVLQDFFKNKGAKVNIGIFSMAGENILISKLGKFKMFLARGNDNIDILNNITLFNKEHIQDKEFSSVLSGKIMPKDKLFAFYPSRSIVAREKNIKKMLLDLDPETFDKELSAINQSSENFSCAAVHILVDKYVEPAKVKSIQPRELRHKESQSINNTVPKAVLARTEKSTKEKVAAPPEIPQDIKSAEEAALAQMENSSTMPPRTENSGENETAQDNLQKSNVSYPGSQNLSSPGQSGLGDSEQQDENQTLLRPTEFSSAKKENFLSAILRKYKPSGVYVIGQNQFLSNKKIIWTSSGVAFLLLAAVIMKFTLIPSLPVPGIKSEDDKALNALLEQTQEKIESAVAYKNQNNLFEARRLLLESLADLNKSDSKDEDVQQTKADVYGVLDQIDKATQSAPSLLYQISQELGGGKILASVKNKILVYAPNSNEDSSGTLIESTDNGIDNLIKVTGLNPIYIIGKENLAVFFDKLSDKMGSLALDDGELKTSSLALSGSVINMYPYQDNLYILTSNGIYKITDASSGKTNVTSWLEENALLPPDPILISVDSKIFIINKNGFLTTYYRGEKQSEVSTSIPINQNSSLLTIPDSNFLYLVDKDFGRIYVLAKSNGELEKTIKLGNEEPLISASISENGMIYLLTSDNKVWSINP